MADRYVMFPGTAGSFVETPDENLLDADTAHCQQSNGQWNTGINFTPNHVLSPPFTPLFGTAAVSMTRNIGSSDPSRFESSHMPVLNGAEEQSFMVELYTEADASDRTYGVELYAYDSGDAELGKVGDSGDIQITPGVPQVVEIPAFTPPAAAALLRVIVWIRGAVTSAGESFYVGASCLRLGSDPTFVPSLRIVGDLDLEAQVALTAWSGTHRLIGNSAGFDGYDLTVQNTLIVVNYNDGSAARGDYTVFGAGEAGQTYRIRGTVDVDTGAVVFYVDGVQIDTGAVSAGPGSPASSDLTVGAVTGGTAYNLDGNLYSAEVRDGIDGPIVASWSAEDIVLP